MAAKRDYYEVLGVAKSSSADEIKSQYRKLALKFHPDRNQSADAAEHFKEISEAYAVLSDSEKRQVYDTHGHAGVDGRYNAEDIYRGASDGFSDVFGEGGFGSIFETIFGSRDGLGGRQQRGSDILYETQITLEDVMRGKRIEVDLEKEIGCGACNGTGCKPGTSKNTCKTCGGAGQVRKGRQMGFASFVTVVPCSACRGAGSIIETPCDKCGGNRRVRGKEKTSFEIPRGVESGDYTMRGQGNQVPGGVNGDLIVRIRVLPHEFFKRDGMDIYYDHDVSMVNATLGCDIIVPTLDGAKKLKVKSGCQPNTIIQMRGGGLPHPNGYGKGDQIVRIVVNIPSKINKRQKKILEDFQRESD